MLEQTIREIGNLDTGAMQKARERLDSLIKPPQSLGRLEELAVLLAGITGDPRPKIKERAVIVLAGDHGVVEEGVSVAPQEITRQMLPAFLRGVAGIGVLSRLAGARLVVVDVGVASAVKIPGVLDYKVRPGTGNIAGGPAMTREEATRAVEAGIAVSRAEIERGADLLALGDMGIGNTTPSSAILAVFSGCPAEAATGRGTLVNEAIWRQKVRVVEQAIAVNRPDPKDPLDVLAKVGGLEIAGLAGVILGAAAARRPVLLDGFITTAAALAAVKLAPGARQFLLAAHLSAEKGHDLMLGLLDLKPMLQLEMRLGEGTGAVLAMHLVEAATRIINEMWSFSEAAVSDLFAERIGRQSEK